MGKGYLNAQEKRQLLILGALSAFLDDLVGENGMWVKLRKPPKKRIKYARLSKTYVGKVIEEMIEDIEQEQMLKILREINTLEVTTKYKNEAERGFEEKERQKDVILYDMESLKDMADVLLGDTCYKCKREGKEVAECAVREVLLGADIEPLEHNPKEGFCPYQDREEEQ